jgi:hypothetical protein
MQRQAGAREFVAIMAFAAVVIVRAGLAATQIAKADIVARAGLGWREDTGPSPIAERRG